MDNFNLIFKRLVTDYFDKNIYFLLFYTFVVFLTWPFESIALSKLYSNLVTSIKKKVDFKQLFNFKNNILEGNIFGNITLIFIVWIILLCTYAYKHTLEEKLIPDYVAYVRLLLINGTINSRVDNFKEIKVGEYLTIISELTNIFEDVLYQTTNRLLPMLLGLLLINIYYYSNNIFLGLLTTMFILLRLITTYTLGIDYTKTVSERDTAYFKMSENFSDVFNNTMNIHLNNTVKEEEEKQEKISKEYSKLVIREMELRKSITFVTNTITIIIFISTLLFSIYLYNKNKIPLSVLLTITFIEIKLVGTWIELDGTIIKFFKRLAGIYASEELLGDVLRQADEVNNICNIKDGSVKLKNITFGYKENEYVFNNMNLDVKQGERVGLLGRSGSGKSTLMKILVGLQSVSDGEVIIGKCNVNNIKKEELRKDITYINQKTSLFDGTVLDNIIYGNNISKKEVNEYLHKYNLHDIYSGLKNGINTNVGVGGSKLSLGMQKVTIILRGIFKESKIYIFDEPLAGLDKNTREKVINIVNDIPKNKTIIVVTHDPEILTHLDKVYEIHKLSK
tara:strand:- start:2336 stop:4027 length:1692 start_codon:yes stop_codon:yes gene_type:complete